MNDATIPDDAWTLPPLAPTGRGIYRLRDGSEEKIVPNTGNEAWPWRNECDSDCWTIGGAELYGRGRFPRDIVALVSLAPTGPGVYETAAGWTTAINGRDDKGWYCSPDGCVRRDEFGRALDSDNRRRLPAYDLRRRIGDLPAEPMNVAVPDVDQRSWSPTFGAPLQEAVAESQPAPGTSVTFQPFGENAWQWTSPDGTRRVTLLGSSGGYDVLFEWPSGSLRVNIADTDMLRQVLREAGAIAPDTAPVHPVGWGSKPGPEPLVLRWDAPPVDADAQLRAWGYRPVYAEQSPEDRRHAAEVMAAMMEEPLAVAVRRDELRRLIGMACGMCGRAVTAVGYRALKHAADAGEFDLPPWLTDYAREQGWDGGAE